MKNLRDGSSIIAVGGWNAQIFSPEWLQKNVCDDKECQVELAFPINSPASLPRLGFEDIHLFISPLRLELRPQKDTSESFAKCSKSLKKILTVLKHTPITSFGVNFTFVSDEDHDEIIQKFILADNASFDAEKNELKKTIIQRTFKQQDDSVLNLSIAIEGTDVLASFNYHRDVPNADVCIEKLVDDITEHYYTYSKSILNDVYGVQVTSD